MKKTFFLLLFACHCVIAYTQDPGKPNSNHINNNLNKFVGTWQWTNNEDTLTIVLKKENILVPLTNEIHADIIVGFHLYKRGNSVIENNLSYANTNYEERKYSIFGTEKGNDTLTASIKELSNHNRAIDLTLIIKEKPIQMEWRCTVLKREESTLHFGKDSAKASKRILYKREMVLPARAILTKIE